MMSLLAQGSRNWRAMKRTVNMAVVQVALASSLLLGSTGPVDNYTVNIAVHRVMPIAPADVESYPVQDVSIRLLLDPIDGLGDREICEHPSEVELALSGKPFLSSPPWECSITVSGSDPALLVMVQVWLHFEAEAGETSERVDIHPAPTQSDIIGWYRPSTQALQVLELPDWGPVEPEAGGEFTFERLDGWFQASVLFELDVKKPIMMATASDIADDG